MCRKILHACILCTLALSISSAETPVPPGNVSGIWDAVGSPYSIGGNITVQSGETLIVEPGVSIEFQGRYSLTVQGWLYAEGTAEDSITFSASDELTGWKGIRFIDAPDSSRLSYCTFLHGRATGSGSEARGGAVYAASSNLTISHSTMTSNQATNTGGAISADGSGLVIERCLIAANSADNSGGGIYAVESLLQITHNTISDNAASWGGGIYFSNDFSSSIINSIISDNNGNGGILLDASDNISIAYSDINNDVNFFGALPLGLGNLVAVNINGDSCDAYDNIYLDPLFIDPGAAEYSLHADSPCIDAGDPLSPQDPDLTIADMGAFPYNQSLWTEEASTLAGPVSFALPYNYPNPFNPVTTIHYSLSLAGHVTLKIYSASGQLIAELVDGYRTPGEHESTFDATGLPSGLYFYRLETGNNSASGKMVLLK